MTSKEINRANITAFVARALNRAGASAVDLEFGLRMREAKVTPLGNIVLDFDGGVALVLASETVCRDIANAN
jgi:hypothetical protein